MAISETIKPYQDMGGGTAGETKMNSLVTFYYGDIRVGQNYIYEVSASTGCRLAD